MYICMNIIKLLTYLLVFFFFVIWLVFFLLCHKLHRQMFIIGLFLVASSPVNIIWHYDYWHPLYIFGTSFRFEDFFWGFAFAGIAATAYEFFFHKHLRAENKLSLVTTGLRMIKLLFIIIIGLLFIFTNILGLNSIYSISIGIVATIIYMLWQRRDLIYPALWSGFFSLLFIFIFYIIWLHIYPGVFVKFWQMNVISGILVLGIPVEELIWFFLAGMLLGPMYEFITGAYVVNDKN